MSIDGGSSLIPARGLMSGGAQLRPVVIVGAGPAGLALAYQLKLRQIPCLLLEKGPNVASSFRGMYKSIFFGPWLNNALPGGPVPWQQAFSRTRRKEWLEYLESFAGRNALEVRCGVEVASVDCNGCFRLQTNQGPIEAELLVNATGYFGNPFTPEYPGSQETRIAQMHACAYLEPATVAGKIEASRGRILIVGKRISAGELMVELHQAGYQVSLSCRRKLRFGSSYLQQALFAPIVMLFESIGAWLGIKLSDTNPRMVGGTSQQLVRSGQVEVFPDIREILESTVRFVDAREAAFDLIIYSTGYRPVLSHLKSLVSIDPKTGHPPLVNMEARDVPGLFFMGLDNQRSFRSRYLRGIREDAVALAERIATRVSSLTRPAG
ncbi:NAD(P)/FAD-dependent oxidoreductase [bacterium CPR1]|nr:NAD(P)/FAD-dependent oxidoreductase [bacterium CPR1]